jgi:quercetin dioxygenase-like cupin family protein
MRRLTYTTVFALIATVLAGGIALAAIVPTIFIRGTLSDEVKVNVPGLAKFENKAPVDFVHATLTFGPGDRTPWHYHPGPTFVTVQQGQITFQESDCSTRTYTAGQSFVEGGADNVGRAQNTGTTDARVYVLFVTPVGAPMTVNLTSGTPTCP